MKALCGCKSSLKIWIMFIEKHFLEYKKLLKAPSQEKMEIKASFCRSATSNGKFFAPLLPSDSQLTFSCTKPLSRIRAQLTLLIL